MRASRRPSQTIHQEPQRPRCSHRASMFLPLSSRSISCALPRGKRCLSRSGSEAGESVHYRRGGGLRRFRCDQDPREQDDGNHERRGGRECALIKKVGGDLRHSGLASFNPYSSPNYMPGNHTCRRRQHLYYFLHNQPTSMNMHDYTLMLFHSPPS
jgi:hypothetical protein